MYVQGLPKDRCVPSCMVFRTPRHQSEPRENTLPTLSQLLDFLHLANKGMLDVIRNKRYQPQAGDFATLKEIGKMGLQLHAVSLATADTLKRRKNGEPEVDEVVG